MNIAVNSDFGGILAILRLMKEVEISLAEFYKACGAEWSGDREFWLHVAEEETKHAEYIEKMIEIVSKRPEHFEKGRPFSPFAVKTFINGVLSNIQKIKKKQLQQNNTLFIARDFEQSLIEYRYSEIVKTGDIEFMTLMSQIISDTGSHKADIDKKISATKKP